MTSLRSAKEASISPEDRKLEVCETADLKVNKPDSLTVSLARAVYSRASILFLDDVLSAGK